MNLAADRPEVERATDVRPSGVDRARDRLVAACCMVVGFVAVFTASAWIVPFLRWTAFDNLYFQADCSLVYANMTDQSSNHYRTGMHPLFSLVMWPLVEALHATGLGRMGCVRLVLAGNAGLASGLTYLIFRRIGLCRLDAVLFVLTLLASSATLFWSTVPETFAFGGTTILVMLWIVASFPEPRPSLMVLGNVLTMSMTLTNWMAGLYATMQVYGRRWRRSIAVAAAAAAIVGVLGVCSKLIFQSAGYAGDFRRYLQWVRLPQASDLKSFFVHSVVMPAPIFRPAASGIAEAVVEPAPLASGTGVGPVALVLWLGLLAAGIVGSVANRGNPRLRNVLLLTLASQFLLHLVFADGPFLFSAHFTPLLVLVAGYSTQLVSRAWLVRSVLTGALLLIAYNNAIVFHRTTSRFETEVLPRLQERSGSPGAVDSPK